MGDLALHAHQRLQRRLMQGHFKAQPADHRPAFRRRDVEPQRPPLGSLPQRWGRHHVGISQATSSGKRRPWRFPHHPAKGVFRALPQSPRRQHCQEPAAGGLAALHHKQILRVAAVWRKNLLQLPAEPVRSPAQSLSQGVCSLGPQEVIGIAALWQGEHRRCPLGGDAAPAAGGGEVRPGAGLPLLHLCHLLGTAGDRTAPGPPWPHPLPGGAGAALW